MAATDVCRESRSRGFRAVKIGSMVVDASAVDLAFERAFGPRAIEEEKELTEPTTRAASTATTLKQTDDIFMVVV